eukprot:4142995-Pyramimonas_sp.AAC.1
MFLRMLLVRPSVVCCFPASFPQADCVTSVAQSILTVTATLGLTPPVKEADIYTHPFVTGFVRIAPEGVCCMCDCLQVAPAIRDTQTNKHTHARTHIRHTYTYTLHTYSMPTPRLL